MAIIISYHISSNMSAKIDRRHILCSWIRDFFNKFHVTNQKSLPSFVPIYLFRSWFPHLILELDSLNQKQQQQQQLDNNETFLKSFIESRFNGDNHRIHSLLSFVKNWHLNLTDQTYHPYLELLSIELSNVITWRLSSDFVNSVCFLINSFSDVQVEHSMFRCGLSLQNGNPLPDALFKTDLFLFVFSKIYH